MKQMLSGEEAGALQECPGPGGLLYVLMCLGK